MIIEAFLIKDTSDSKPDGAGALLLTNRVDGTHQLWVLRSVVHTLKKLPFDKDANGEYIRDPARPRRCHVHIAHWWAEKNAEELLFFKEL